MIPPRNPVRFYWQVVDRFLRSPGDWRFLGTDWEVERVVQTKRCMLLRATISAGLSFETGKYTMAARVQVEGGRSDASARSALRDLVEVADSLRTHGFRWHDKPFAHYPLLAWKSVYPRTFTTERTFLSELTRTNVGTTRRCAPRSLRGLLDGFRGRLAGDWHPVNGRWELRKPIRIAGRTATAICMLHLARADREGRLGAASSITIWPPWNRKGPLPLWLAKNREALDSQFRDAGHKAEWHCGPRGRGVMITSMREDLDGLPGVLRERRVLEAAHLGDPD